MLLASYLLISAPLPFVPSWWGPDGAGWHDVWHRRHRMADGLIITGKLMGASRSDVTGLLGEPSDHGYFRDYDLVYQLGSERGFFGIDSEWLAIRLDEHGIVHRVEIVHD